MWVWPARLLEGWCGCGQLGSWSVGEGWCGCGQLGLLTCSMSHSTTSPLESLVSNCCRLFKTRCSFMLLPPAEVGGIEGGGRGERRREREQRGEGKEC